MSIDKITPEEWDAKTELTKEQMEMEDKCDFQGDVEDLDMVNKKNIYKKKFILTKKLQKNLKRFVQ